MDKAQQGNSYSSHLEELSELMAWRGYEFWSAQIEAEMEFSCDLEQSATVVLGQMEPKKGRSDVFPF